jgi:hypothetical protein
MSEFLIARPDIIFGKDRGIYPSPEAYRQAATWNRASHRKHLETGLCLHRLDTELHRYGRSVAQGSSEEQDRKGSYFIRLNGPIRRRVKSAKALR